MHDVQILSTIDGSLQPATFYAPRKATSPNASAAPLLVALHQWSCGYDIPSAKVEYFTSARKRGWAVIHPHFRGRNDNPHACASEPAMQDILDAVTFARRNACIDPKRVYLLGCSGGGHMTLRMAAKAPQLWAAASAWVPIFDLTSWYAETKRAGHRYWKMLEAVCGVPPGTSEKIDREYRRRSPKTYLRRAADIPLDINAGIHDGHTGSVPISHSLLAFNLLARANGRPEKQLRASEIRSMVKTESIPAGLKYGGKETDRKHVILFRRHAGPARITIFEGGHEIDSQTAMNWLATKRKR